MSTSEDSQTLFAIMAYRCLIVATGGLFAYLGYRLFVLGIYEKAGDLKASWKGASLLIRQAAPGTFFALFGTTIIAVALLRPAEFHNRQSVAPAIENPVSAGGPEIQDSAQLPAPNATKALTAIIDKLHKGEPLTKKDQELLEGLLLDLEAASLSHKSESDAHSMVDNMK